MKVPRNLNGVDFAAALVRKWDYVQVRQNGSHILLLTQLPFPHSIAVPAHKPLRVWTLTGMLLDVANHKGVTKLDILNCI